MTTPLFGDCNIMTVSGIKSLRLAAKLEDGMPISYPIDFVVLNGEESTVRVLVDTESQLITVDSGQVVQYVEPTTLNSSFEEVEVKDRRGTYYQTTITFQFPKVELYTNNQIKDFLFNDEGEFAIANATVFLEDNNGVNWIIGYDLPMVVDSFEATTGGGDNAYTMTLVGRSYNRARRLVYFTRLQPNDSILINDTDFITIDGTDLIFI